MWLSGVPASGSVLSRLQGLGLNLPNGKGTADVRWCLAGPTQAPRCSCRSSSVRKLNQNSERGKSSFLSFRVILNQVHPPPHAALPSPQVVL